MKGSIDSRPDRFWKVLALLLIVYFAFVLFGCEGSSMEDDMTCEQRNELINAMADDQYKGFEKIDPSLYKRVEKWRNEHLRECE